jgi:hypothetical protein
LVKQAAELRRLCQEVVTSHLSLMAVEAVAVLVRKMVMQQTPVTWHQVAVVQRFVFLPALKIFLPQQAAAAVLMVVRVVRAAD